MRSAYPFSPHLAPPEKFMIDVNKLTSRGAFVVGSRVAFVSRQRGRSGGLTGDGALPMNSPGSPSLVRSAIGTLFAHVVSGCVLIARVRTRESREYLWSIIIH